MFIIKIFLNVFLYRKNIITTVIYGKSSVLPNEIVVGTMKIIRVRSRII